MSTVRLSRFCQGSSRFCQGSSRFCQGWADCPFVFSHLRALNTLEPFRIRPCGAFSWIRRRQEGTASTDQRPAAQAEAAHQLERPAPGQRPAPASRADSRAATRQSDQQRRRASPQAAGSSPLPCRQKDQQAEGQKEPHRGRKQPVTAEGPQSRAGTPPAALRPPCPCQPPQPERFAPSGARTGARRAWEAGGTGSGSRITPPAPDPEAAPTGQLAPGSRTRRSRDRGSPAAAREARASQRPAPARAGQRQHRRSPPAGPAADRGSRHRIEAGPTRGAAPAGGTGSGSRITPPAPDPEAAPTGQLAPGSRTRRSRDQGSPAAAREARASQRPAPARAGQRQLAQIDTGRTDDSRAALRTGRPSRLSVPFGHTAWTIRSTGSTRQRGQQIEKPGRRGHRQEARQQVAAGR